MIDAKDLNEVRLSRPIAVVDLWDIDDRFDRLEDAVNRLEKVVENLILLYQEERVKSWELILREMLKQHETKKGNADGRRFR